MTVQINRKGVEGEYWPETHKIGKYYSRGLWKYEEGKWNQAVDPMGVVVSPEFMVPDLKLRKGDEIFRIANRDQFVIHPDLNVPVHLSPQHLSKRYNENVRINFAENLGRGIRQNTDLLSGYKDLKSVLSDAKQLSAIINSVFNHNVRVYAPGGRIITSRQARISSVLVDKYEDLRSAASQQWDTIGEFHRQLIYIYNGYLGTFEKPQVYFGNVNDPLTPDILNMFCDVRFFSPKDRVLSCMNYLLYPGMFKNQDIYQRGVNDHIDYVVIQIPYDEELERRGHLQTTRYRELQEELEGIYEHGCGIQCNTNVNVVKSGRDRAIRNGQLLNMIPIWGDIFQEIRLVADFIIPEKIYMIDADLVDRCDHKYDGMFCPFCSTFSIDWNDCVFDVNNLNSSGSLQALFGMKENKFLEQDRLLTRNVKERHWHVGEYSKGITE